MIWTGKSCSNDALRKHGILPAREPTPKTPSPPPSPSLDDLLDDFSINELRELSEDAPDDETERYIAAHRQKRLQELKQEERRARFGRVYPIGREEYTKEVTEASNIDEEDDKAGKGTGVICFLYKDGSANLLSFIITAKSHIVSLEVIVHSNMYALLLPDIPEPNLS